MGTITKKLKRSIVMLLVCALTVGSVPMNTYAAELQGDHLVTVDAENATVTVSPVSDNDTVYPGMNEDQYSVVSGNNIKVTVEEEYGYKIDAVSYTVSKNTCTVDKENWAEFEIENIQGNVDIDVDTSARTYAVKVVSENNATVTAPTNATYGEALKFTVAVDEDKYEVEEVKYVMDTKDGEDEKTLGARTGEFEINPVTGAVNIYVTTKEKAPVVKTYKVSVSENDNAEVIFVEDTVSNNEVKENTVIKFTVEAEEGYEVTEVAYVMGDAEAVEAKVVNGVYETAPVTADVKIVVETEKTTEDEPTVEPEEKMFSIEVVAEHATVTFGDSVSYNTVAAGAEVEFTVTPDEGYDVTSVRYIMDGRAVRYDYLYETFFIEEVTADVRIEVTTAEEVAVKKVVVKGVKNDKLVQTDYTWKEYPVTFDPTNVNDVKVETTGDIAAWLDGNMLTVVTLPGTEESVSANTVVIKDTKGNAIEGGTFAVETQTQKFLNGTSAPSVKVKSTTNASVMLTLNSKGLVDKDTWADVFYNVTLTPVDNDEVGVVTATIKRTGDSQDARIVLEDKEGKELVEGLVEGTIKYEVKVELGADVSLDVDVEKILLGESSKVVTAETQKPAYETKLKLKKGKTKIIAGEASAEYEAVTVATAVFSKGTTYRNLDVYGYYADGSYVGDHIKVWYDESTETIRATVDKDAPAGKYTIYVNSQVPVDEKGNQLMLPSQAKIDITIVGGIDGIENVDAPESIYRKDGKNATFNVTYNAWDKFVVDFDYDENGKIFEYFDSVKLNKSNVKYSVVDVYGDADTDLNKYITVNNKGKVTVSKDLDISGNNGFRIRVDANDYAGNDVYAESNIINVTNVVTEVGEVVLVNYDYENDVYKVIAENNDEVTIDEIRWTSVRALKAGKTVSKNDTVSENDLIPVNAISLKVNNKNFVLEGNEVAGLKKAVSNLKITATMKDGSGSKNTLVLKNVFGYLGDLRLNAYYQDGGISFNSVKDGEYVGYYKGVQRTLLTLYVTAADGSWIDGRAASFTVSPKNTNTVYKDGIWFDLEPKSDKAVEVTLKYKNSDKKTVTTKYTLINESLVDARKIEGNVKVEGNFVENTYSTVKVKLPECFEGQYVKFAPDHVKYYKDDKYENFADQILYNDTYIDGEWTDRSEKVYQVSDNTIEVSADALKGSYKMYLSVGTYEDGVFKPTTFEKAVTFKVVAFTRVKLATSYTLYLSDGDTVALKSTSKSPLEFVLGVFNDNVKGQSNDFLSVFSLNWDDYTLTYNGDLNPSKKPYTAVVRYFDGYELKSVKIKINVKLGSASKLSAPSVKVLEGTDILVPVTKKNVEDFSIFAVDGKGDASGYVNKYEGNMIDVSGNLLNKSKTVEAYVVGDDAYELIKEAAVSDNANITEYGQNVKFKVTVLDDKKATKTDKVKADKVVFTEDDYNSVVDSYVTVGEYTESIIGVSAVSANSVDDCDVKVALHNGVLTYEVMKDTLDKEGLYGETITIPVVFDFGTYGTEKENVKVTFPKKSEVKELNVEVKGHASVSVNGTTVSDNGTIKVYGNEFSYEVVVDEGYEYADMTVSANGVELEARYNEWNESYTVDVADVEAEDTVVIDIATTVVETPEEDPVVPAQFSVSFNCVSANGVTVSANAVTVSANGVSVSANGESITVSENDVCNFTVSANEGYEVEYVSVDGKKVSAENGVYTFTVTKDTEVTIVVKAEVIVEEAKVVSNNFFISIFNALKSLFFWS